ncbi:hypothetical protein NMY22_g5295 [Coprinellus aureogranulatus]|nr:hypothetical protein NMY22_g5295 [Coprinellus aureogranulatus]
MLQHQDVRTSNYEYILLDGFDIAYYSVHPALVASPSPLFVLNIPVGPANVSRLLSLMRASLHLVPSINNSALTTSKGNTLDETSSRSRQPAIRQVLFASPRSAVHRQLFQSSQQAQYSSELAFCSGVLPDTILQTALPELRILGIYGGGGGRVTTW